MVGDKGGMHIAIFRGKAIRRKLVGDKWYFAVVDIMGALTDSPRPKKYWFDLKMKLAEEGYKLSAKIGQLKFISGDGKVYLTDCADTEGIFRYYEGETYYKK